MGQLNFVTQKLEETQDYGKFSIGPLPYSFGLSLGNALRRTLLSSLPGSAITYVKFRGAAHTFSTLKGVRESAIEIILNMKQLRIKTQGEGPFKITLSSKGERKLFGRDIEGDVQIINGDLYLAEITDKQGKLEIEAIVELGYGYGAAEEREKKELDFFPVDAFFSPVKKVNISVEENRIGRRTDFDRLIVEIWTDGTVVPTEALRDTARLLASYFEHILSGKDEPKQKVTEKEDQQIKKEPTDEKLKEIIIDELNLPSRVINALLRENIETVADLVKIGRDKLIGLKGVGKKSIDLIKDELKKMGIELK